MTNPMNFEQLTAQAKALISATRHSSTVPMLMPRRARHLIASVRVTDRF